MFDVLAGLATASSSRPLAMTWLPAASAALAISAPIPRVAPLINPALL